MVECPWKLDPYEFDIALVKAGFMTEADRIEQGYIRILRDMMKRRTGART